MIKQGRRSEEGLVSKECSSARGRQLLLPAGKSEETFNLFREFKIFRRAFLVIHR